MGYVFNPFTGNFDASGSGGSSGTAGGDLTGTYPNPTIKASVSLSGSPTTTTQAANDNSTKIATTAYVDAQASASAPTSGTGITVTGVSVAINTAVTVDKTTIQALTNKDLTSGTNTFPTFNQNTSGSAAKWTTARSLAGNSVDGSADVPFANGFIVKGTSDTGLSGAQFLGALGTGIVKNTTTTGVLSIASAGDFPTLNQDSTGKSAKTDALNSASTVVNVSSATAPSNGQVLTATGSTAATWQTPSGTTKGLTYVIASGIPTL